MTVFSNGKHLHKIKTGATDDLDRSEYEKPTDTWLVQGMHATDSLTGHEVKLTQGRYLQVIGVGISISSIY